MKGRTSFIIAHRLNTIRDANTIMVIQGGEIAEKGNHDELMSEEGIYYQMITNQYMALGKLGIYKILAIYSVVV